MKVNHRINIPVIFGIMLCAVITTHCSSNQTATSTDQAFEPAGILLTWQHDPTTTITIDWHLLAENEDRKPILHFRERGDMQWDEVQARKFEIPHFDRIINRVEIRGLQPDTEYEFRFGDDSEEYYFRTMPATLNRTITYATASDIQFVNNNEMASPLHYDPDFVINPGEGPNVNGDPARVDNWYDWYDGVKRNLITEDNRVIPHLAVIGNHEVFRKSRMISGNAPHHEHTVEEARQYMRDLNLWDTKATYFTSLFAYPGRNDAAYGVLDFGDYLSVILLDSGVHTPVEGGQTGWLDAVLDERKGKMTHILPVYRYSAYPASRPYEGTHRQKVRDLFLPLFEMAGVNVVLESSDRNTYKRTYPLKSNEINENGIVYIGSGNWNGAGRPARDSNEEWYIDRFHGNSHGIVVEIYPDRQEFKAISITGDIFDSFTISAK